MAKLYDSCTLAIDNPVALQRKVYLEDSFHFCLRGREGLHELRKVSFVGSGTTICQSVKIHCRPWWRICPRLQALVGCIPIIVCKWQLYQSCVHMEWMARTFVAFLLSPKHWWFEALLSGSDWRETLWHEQTSPWTLKTEHSCCPRFPGIGHCSTTINIHGGITGLSHCEINPDMETGSAVVLVVSSSKSDCLDNGALTRVAINTTVTNRNDTMVQRALFAGARFEANCAPMFNFHGNFHFN